MDGSQVYVRLWYKTAGAWKSVDFQYTAHSGGTPEITSPVPGSTLSGSSVTFYWTDNGVSVSQWWLHVGSVKGGSDYYNRGVLGTSATVSGLPKDGSQVWARLWYRSGGWKYVDAQYTACRTPEITSPAPGSTIKGSVVTFKWSANGVLVWGWNLLVGSYPGGSDIHNSGTLSGFTTSRTVTGLPANGSTVYVTLRYQKRKFWVSLDVELYQNIALKRDHRSGTESGTGYIAVPYIPQPGLAGFKLNFAGTVDHEINDVEVRQNSNVVDLDYSGYGSSGNHTYYWQVDRQELPPGTTFHTISGRGDFWVKKVMENINGYIPVIRGFDFHFTNGEHHLNIILLNVYKNPEDDRLNIDVWFCDKNLDDPFDYTVEYALIPDDRIRSSGHASGDGVKKSDSKTNPAVNPVLQGFYLDFESGDHEIDELGAMVTPGTTTVWYNDINDDDKFRWDVWWVDVQ